MPVEVDEIIITRDLERVVGTSYLYPLKGILHFCAHRHLWPLFGRRIFPLLAVSILVLGFLFAFTYLPQVAFLAIWHGHLAWVNGVFLVLGEGAVVINLLFEAFLVDETLVDVHDSVLIQMGYVDLISPSRMINIDAPSAPKMLGKPITPAIYSPFSFRQIAEFVLFLPVNFIPVVGSPAFLVLTGIRAGPLHHWRYFHLQGLTKKERKAQIKSRQWKYTWFGTVALALQLVPVASMFFLLTTAAGSALWVAHLEDQKKLMAIEPVEVVDDEPPAYSDVPPV